MNNHSCTPSLRNSRVNTLYHFIVLSSLNSKPWLKTQRWSSPHFDIHLSHSYASRVVVYYDKQTKEQILGAYITSLWIRIPEFHQPIDTKIDIQSRPHPNLKINSPIPLKVIHLVGWFSRIHIKEVKWN